MASNYPPGVTGFEYEIQGPDYEHETEELCPKCGGAMVEQSYHKSRWVVCCSCYYQRDLESPEPTHIIQPTDSPATKEKLGCGTD